MHTTLMEPAWAQMLVEAGGKDLLMLTNNVGWSCLYRAAANGHVDMGKVQSYSRACVDRQIATTAACRQIQHEECDAHD